MGAPAPLSQSARRGTVRLLVAAVVAVVLAPAALGWLGDGARGDEYPQPVPQARCGPGARPETDIQGRVPRADYESGRVDRGYRCNTRAVSHVGRSGGFKVHRYTDRQLLAVQRCTSYRGEWPLPRQTRSVGYVCDSFSQTMW